LVGNCGLHGLGLTARYFYISPYFLFYIFR
jgi:hypothetical protein